MGVLRIVLLILFTFTACCHAADLRGSFSGLSGASVKVICGEVIRSTKISKNGKFRISKLPANKACSFTVTHGPSVSIATPFSTNKNVTHYKGVLRKVGNKIIVIRK